MAPHYGLKNGSAFHDLTEELVFLACVYQELDDTTAELEAEDVLHSSRRIQGHRLATELRDEAASMLQSLAEIDEKLSKFNSVVRDHPPLLSAIFERDAGQVQSLWYPAQIAILQSFFVEVNWNSAAEVLGRLAALPVREKLARGPMGNVTLRA